MKKILACLLSLTLLISLGLDTTVFAGQISDKKDELNQVEEQQTEVSNNLDELAGKIEEQKQVVEELQGEIRIKQEEIQTTEEEIKQIKADIVERRDGLNSRLRAMYKNGSVGYLDVLLGSNSLSEFLDNVEMIQKIYKADQDTLTQLKQQEDELKQKQTELKEEKAEIGVKVEESEAKQAELQENINTLQSKLEELNQEAESLNSEIKRLQEENRKKREERERQRRLQQQQEQQQEQGDEEPGNVDVDYNGGPFVWPTTSTYITSEFGYRVHPITGIYTGHTGIDIGAGMDSPVYAAADGTVIIAGWYGGYGYAVVIDHGGGISTLYGHNNSLNVSVGDEVSQGQVIAASGSTGNSTGPHVHFEVRVNGACVDPMGYF